jgi:hypothetical protein
MTGERTGSIATPQRVTGIYGLLGGMIYVVGLISPLTPSRGLPTPLALILFAGVPFGIVMAAATTSSSIFVRVILIAEALGILVFTILLLKAQGVF